MKLKHLCFLLGSLFIIGCNSEVPVEQLTYKNGLKVLKESGEPFSGKSIKFENGQSTPSEIVEYKEGRLDGNIQLLYPNGEIKENFYGRLDNQFYMFAQAFDMNERNRERGQKELDEVALKKFLIRYGEEKKWYENGEMESKGSYSEDGSRRVGDWQQWYQNGELKEQGEYSPDLTIPLDNISRRGHSKVKVTGIKTGEWSLWYENGVKSQEIIYRNNQKESILLYCDNGTLGFELKKKGKDSAAEMKIWACDGTEFILRDSENRELKYAKKKAVGFGLLTSTVMSLIETGKYDINADDYYRKSAIENKDGKQVGLMTEWDEDGRVVVVKDYNIANFIDLEYLDAFLKKGRFGSYYKINYESKKWPIARFNFKSAKPDIDAIKLYLDRGLVDPAKKIAIKHSQKDMFGKLKKDQGISQWTYPIIVAPETLFDVLRAYPGVKLDVVDTEGRNRLHLCTILMLGTKPDRCSFEHFKILVNSIPINAEDNYGMTAINYVTKSFHKRGSVRSRRRKGTEDIAIKALQLLAKVGADVNHPDKNGQTALMRALSYQEYKIAEALLGLGAEVNVKDNEGHGALHFVFFEKTKSSWTADKFNFKLNSKRKAVLTLLAQHGVQIDSLNLEGKSIKDVALKHGAIPIVQFLESLSEIKLIAKITPPPVMTSDIEVKPIGVTADQSTEIQAQNNTVQLNNATTNVESANNLTTSTEVGIETLSAIEPGIEEIVVDQEQQLYQKALSQIKRSRLSRPKGNSALDTLNELAELTSEDDLRVKEIRQKIVDKYLSLARGRINDYRYQDAVRFIKTSQRIQPSKKARQLLVKVNDKIAEGALFQQQQQRINAARQAAPVKEKSSFGSIFRSIFD